MTEQGQDNQTLRRLNEVAGAADATSGQTPTTRERLCQASPMLDKQRLQQRMFPDGLIMDREGVGTSEGELPLETRQHF